jgi:hypothetical protein
MYRQTFFLPIAMMALSSCSWGEDKLPDCWTSNIGPSLILLEKAHLSLDNLRQVERRHSLCSTHEDRLNSAEKALLASGYRYKREVAELGDCIKVTITGSLNEKNLRREMTVMCTVAAATRIRYADWSGQVGDQFLFARGDFTSTSQMPPP